MTASTTMAAQFAEPRVAAAATGDRARDAWTRGTAWAFGPPMKAVLQALAFALLLLIFTALILLGPMGWLVLFVTRRSSFWQCWRATQ